MASGEKTIKVRVGADTTHFDVNIKKSTEETKKFRKQVQGASTTGNFMSKQLQKAATASAALHGPLNGISGRLSAMSTAFRIAGVSAAGLGAAMGGIAVGLKSGFQTVVETEHQMARLEGVLIATGHAAGFTAESIDTMAREIAMSTLASTEGVRASAAALATFSTISGDTFERTLRVSQDLAEVMGSDLQGATMQLAKALDAPLLGMNSLRRAGVSFSAQQREEIKNLERTGDLYKQQAIILGAVESQLSGVAEAAAKSTFVGAVDTLGQSFTEFWEKVVMASGAVKAFTGWINTLSESVQRSTREMDLESNSIHTLLGEYNVMTKAIEEQELAVRNATFGTRWAEQKTLDEMKARQAIHKTAIDNMIEKENEANDAADAAAKKAADTLAEVKAGAYAKIRKELDKILNKVGQQTAASEVREAGSSDDPHAKNDAALQKRLEAMEIEKQANMEKFANNEELLRAYQELEIQLIEEHEAKKKEIDDKVRADWMKQREKDLVEENKRREEEFDAKIEMNDAYINAVGSSMSTLAGLMKEGSKARMVLLWAERAATLASINLNIYAAMAEALKAPYPANLIAYGQVATLGASLLANVASMGSMGSRASGGPVAPGGRYMVGEHGPEILQMGVGSGTVIKNEDISPKLNVNIVENPDRGGQVQQEGSDVTVYVQAAVAQLNEDLNSGRGLFASVENRYGLKR